MNRLRSVTSSTASASIAAQKLGQPVPDSNLVADVNRGASQTMQRYTPSSCSSQ
jgi:hypothetical protein